MVGNCAARRLAQRGAALLLLLMLLVLACSAFALSALRGRDAELLRREHNARILAQARQALLVWSLSRDGTAGLGHCSPTSSPNGRACSPLELPCPANPNESAINSIGTSITSCNSAANPASRQGWLPWKTLGIPKLLDAYGEPLWYSVDRGFVVRTQDTEARKINLDSQASLRVFQDDVELTATGDGAAAILFAPGSALAGQNRSPPYEAAQFLDAAGIYHNAQAGGPYVAAGLASDFNDQLLFIRGRELIELVQPRLGVAIASQLQSHWDAFQIAYPPAPSAGPVPSAAPSAPPAPTAIPEAYPYPADILGDTSCRDNVVYAANTGCRSQADLCAGILPRAANDWTGQGRFASPAINRLPVWFRQNIWHRAVFYAVKQGAHCTADFVLDGVAEPDIDALLILPGASQSARADNTQLAANASLDLALYLEDAVHQDKWLQPQTREFVTPACTSNDLMLVCRQGVCSERTRLC
jgi:hypothetical protein